MQHQLSSHQRLEAFMTIARMCFAEFLSTYLEENGKSRRALYRYVQLQGITHDFTAMDKYFNPNPKVNRIPRNKRFVELFAAFLELDAVQTAYLIDLWQFKRKYGVSHKGSQVKPHTKSA